jgi:hypothetical protein
LTERDQRDDGQQAGGERTGAVRAEAHGGFPSATLEWGQPLSRSADRTIRQMCVKETAK